MCTVYCAGTHYTLHIHTAHFRYAIHTKKVHTAHYTVETKCQKNTLYTKYTIYTVHSTHYTLDTQIHTTD